MLQLTGPIIADKGMCTTSQPGKKGFLLHTHLELLQLIVTIIILIFTADVGFITIIIIADAGICIMT